MVLGCLTLHVQSVTLALCGPTLVTSLTHPSLLCERVHSGARCELSYRSAAIISIFTPFCYCSPLHSHNLGGLASYLGEKKKGKKKVWAFLEGFYKQKQTKKN